MRRCCRRCQFDSGLSLFQKKSSLEVTVNFSVRSTVFSAFRAGSLRGLTLRKRQSGTSGGFVIIAHFGEDDRASSFAKRWAKKLGFRCFVRRSRVSVGVRPAACVPLAVTGRYFPVRGLASLLQVLASWGGDLG